MNNPTIRCEPAQRREIVEISRKRVFARFSHTCGICSGIIQRGTEHIYQVFRDHTATLDNGFRTIRYHLRCPPAEPQE